MDKLRNIISLFEEGCNDTDFKYLPFMFINNENTNLRMIVFQNKLGKMSYKDIQYISNYELNELDMFFLPENNIHKGYACNSRILIEKLIDYENSNDKNTLNCWDVYSYIKDNDMSFFQYRRLFKYVKF